MDLNITGMQHPGDRKYQEDAFTHFGGKNWHLLAVADGMGGHVNGDMASATAIESLVEISAQLDQVIAAGNVSAALGVVKAAYNAAHRKCVQANDGRGTTLVTLLVIDDEGWFFNCGDSFGFVFENQQPKRVTIEHADPDYGFLYACIGGETDRWATPEPRCDIKWIGKLNQYDYVVLASDGIVSPDGLTWPDKYETPAESILAQGLATYGAAAPGRCDNVTVLCLQP